MRLKQLSLFAMMSVLIASGCSASRNSIRALRGEGEDVATPPRHDHEYSPSPYDSDDDFQPPAPHTQPGEPVPAPPAIGVSRIKSVGWLKDLGEKIHPRKESCVDDCVSDEELVGKCSPIDSCATESSCETPVRVQRYREQVVHGQTTDRLNPMRSLKNTWAKIFRKPAPVTDTDPCAAVVVEPGCSVPSHVVRKPVQAYSEQCGELRSKKGSVRGEKSDDRNNDRATELRPVRPQNHLADPMLDPTGEEVQPGLLTPEDMLFQEQVAEEGAGTSPESENSESPVPDTHVPTVPSKDDSGGRFEPVPEVPNLPPIADPSTRVVEPPLWPKRKGQIVRQISQSSSGNWNGSGRPGSAEPMPEIVPRKHQ